MPKLFERAFQRLNKQSLFGSEVAVERRLDDACRSCNSVHVNVDIGALREQTDSSLDDVLASPGEHGPVRDSVHRLIASCTHESNLGRAGRKARAGPLGLTRPPSTKEEEVLHGFGNCVRTAVSIA